MTEKGKEKGKEKELSSVKMSERDESPSSSSFIFPFQILIDSLTIFSRNKQLFLSIFVLFTLPLSLLLFTLSLSSHPLKSHILHLESVLLHAPTRFEYRHVFEESRHDAFSLLRLRFAFFLPIYALSLLSAIATVTSTLQSFTGKRSSLKSSLDSSLPWRRPLVTSICIYGLLMAYAILPHALASLFPSVRFLILCFGLIVEVYVIAIASLGLVVSIAEERFGWDAIRVGSGMMAGRRISGSGLTGGFVLVLGWIVWEMEGVMDGVDHWVRDMVTWRVVIGVGDKVGLVCLYGVVILFGYVVTTVFYCECRKRDFCRVDYEDEQGESV